MFLCRLDGTNELLFHNNVASSNATSINSTNTNATTSNVTCSYVNEQCLKVEYNATLTSRTPNISLTITKYTVLWGPYVTLYQSVKFTIGKDDVPTSFL